MMKIKPDSGLLYAVLNHVTGWASSPALEAHIGLNVTIWDRHITALCGNHIRTPA